MARARKSPNRPKRGKNTFVTHSGNTIKINRTMGDKLRARGDNLARRRAERLATLPKSHFKRFISKLKPSYQFAYWSSGEGALMSLKIVGVGIVLLFVLLVGLFAYFRKDLPQLNNISGQNLGGSITYYDSTGKVVLWQDYNAVKRIPVQGDQISTYMKDATVAIEDKNFYHEGAFSVTGTLRAAIHDVAGGGGGLQGGSTITQQLVKLNEGWTNDKTVTRKVKELILAVDVSREYSKSQILTGYLNIAPYGGVDYGVQAAAEDYFRENASQLTLAQSAMLAAIPQSPSFYSPYNSPVYNPSVTINDFGEAALTARADYILQIMVTQGYITKAQSLAAQKVNVLSEVHQEQTLYSGIQDPYFVLAAKQELEDKYGASTVNHGGWKVITTLNLQLQNYAEQDVIKNEPEIASVGGDEEAMVAENVHNGQVVAMVGGENFNDPTDGQLNFATLKIQPGSSLKPFMYADLIQNNTDAGAGSVLYDTQTALPGYPCTNKSVPSTTGSGASANCLWDDNDEYPGPETIRYALAGSRNVPAVEASLEVDPTDTSADDYTKSINDWINTANEAMGTKNAYACYNPGTNVDTDTAAQMTQCYGSAVLGSGAVSIADIVNGDTTFANEGEEIPQSYILNISNDATGQTIYKWTQPAQTEVYKPDTAYIINDMLDDPRATYLPSFQKFQNYDGWDIAVKTGTENQSFNGVMTAWTTQYAVVGFAGYHTLNKQLELGQFENATEPITKTWIEQALTALAIKPINWTAPTDIKTLPSFIETTSTGYGQEVPSPSTDVYPSWYTGPSSSNKAVTVDKISGDVATSCTPTLAQETIGGTTSDHDNIDIFYPIQYSDMQALEGGTSGSTSSITQTDDVHSCNDPTLASPSITVADSTSGATVPVAGVSNEYSCISSCDIQVLLGSPPPPTTTLGTDAYARYPVSVNLLVNGSVVSTQSVASSSDYSNDTSTPLTFTYTPTSTPSNVSVQIVDNALYSVTSGTTQVVQGP